MDRLIAHSREYAIWHGTPSPIKEDEGLVQHSLQASDLGEFEALRLGKEGARLAPEVRFGLLVHDFGKGLWAINQDRTMRDCIMPPESPSSSNLLRHEALGALLAYQRGFNLAMFAIWGHHLGIPSCQTVRDYVSKISRDPQHPHHAHLEHALLALRSEADRERNGDPTFKYCTNQLYSMVEGKSTPDSAVVMFDKMQERCLSPISRQIHCNDLDAFNANISWFVDLRMVSGCFIRADHAATSFYIDGSNFAHKKAMYAKQTDWEKVYNYLLTIQAFLFNNSSSRTMARIRARIQKQVMKRFGYFDRRCNMSLLAATGTGKTLALLLGAVKRILIAQKEGRPVPERILFVEPTISIMSQLFNNFKDWDKICLLHEMADERERQTDLVLPRYTGGGFHKVEDQQVGGETWDHFPIVITSQVMLMRALFSNSPKDLKLFPAFNNAVVIIDDDLIPWNSYLNIPSGASAANLREPAACALDDLAKRFGTVPVWGSATGLKLSTKERRINKDDSRLNDARPIRVFPLLSFRRNAKVNVKLNRRVLPIRRRDLRTPADWANFAATLEVNSVIVKANTKRLAWKTFDCLKPTFNGKIFLLYGNKLSRHNLETIKEISIMSELKRPMERSQVLEIPQFKKWGKLEELLTRLQADGYLRSEVVDGKTMLSSCRYALVCTSMGQNGLDLSFEAGLTQVGSMSDMLQLPGRINRHKEKRRAKLYIVGIVEERTDDIQNFFSELQFKEAEDCSKDIDRLIKNGKFFSPFAYRKISERTYMIRASKGLFNPAMKALVYGRHDELSDMARIIDESDHSIIIKTKDSPEIERDVDAIIEHLDTSPTPLPMNLKVILRENSIGLYDSDIKKALAAKRIRESGKHLGVYIALDGAYDSRVGLKIF